MSDHSWLLCIADRPWAVALLIFALEVTSFTGGCRRAPPRHLHEPSGVLRATDAAASVAALAQGLEATAHAWSDKPGVTCPVLLGVSAGLRSASQVIATINVDSGSVELPDVSVDLDSCAAWTPPAGADISTDVQLVVDSASFALTLGSIAVGRIGDERTRCMAKQVLESAESYLSAALPEVLSEISAPDGMFALDGVLVDLRPCVVSPSGR